MSSKPVRVNLAGEVELDPKFIYYTHSKIRPFFSGCGKRIVDTIAEIESGKTNAKDLPQMSVIQDAEGHTYCMNNRRLYVFKHLRRLGLLEGDTITVRVKKAIPRELAKYTPQNCSLNCTIIREKAALELDKEQESTSTVEDVPVTVTPVAATVAATATATASASASAGVREKNDKKKFHVADHEETDEERYLRQKQKIEEAKEKYKRDAAERLRQKEEIAALLKESGECDDDDDTGSSSEEDEVDVEELFVCNLCSKEFKSVEQIEQHFQSKAHKKNVQESIRKKKERERKAANRELGRQKKLAKAKAKASGGEIGIANLSLLPPKPPTPAVEKALQDAQNVSIVASNEDDNSSESSESSSSSEDEDDDDEDYMLAQMASNKCRQGLPDVDSDSD